MNRNRSMELYMKEHLSLYIFVGVIFLTGVVFGTVMAGALSLEQKQEIMRFIGNFFHRWSKGPWRMSELHSSSHSVCI